MDDTKWPIVGPKLGHFLSLFSHFEVILVVVFFGLPYVVFLPPSLFCLCVYCGGVD